MQNQKASKKARKLIRKSKECVQLTMCATKNAGKQTSKMIGTRKEAKVLS